MRIVFAPLLLDEVSAMNKHHLNTHLRLQDFQDSDTLETLKTSFIDIQVNVFHVRLYIGNTRHEHNWTWEDLLNHKWHVLPTTTPLLPKTPNIYLNQTPNDRPQSGCFNSCESHSSLGFKGQTCLAVSSYRSISSVNLMDRPETPNTFRSS